MKRILFFIVLFPCLLNFTLPDFPGKKPGIRHNETMGNFLSNAHLSLKTSDLLYDWDTLTLSDSLGLKEKRTRELDNRGRILSELNFVMDSAGWKNNQRYTHTYDDIGQRCSVEGERWVNGAWELFLKRRITLNSSGQELITVTQRLVSGAWQSSDSISQSYDAKGHGVMFCYAYWQDGIWIMEERFTMTYDNNGNLISESDDMWVDGAWKTLGTITYTLDGSGKVLQSVWSRPKNGTLLQLSRSTYTYNADSLISVELEEQWDTLNQSWEKQYRNIQDYDNHGNLTTRLMEAWDASNSFWTNLYRTSFKYDELGNSTDGTNEKWAAGSWQPTHRYLDVYSRKQVVYTFWFPYYRYHASFKSYTSGVDPSDIAPQLSIYPNPAENRLFLDGNNINFDSEVSVYDLTGRPVLQFRLNGRTEIDLGRLAAGTYLLRLNSGKETISKVFVKR